MSQNLLNISLSVDKEELRELIKKVIEGEWRLYLPQFQRDFEWDEEDIRYFFDSIIRNLPVGSIILWKPSRRIEEDPFAVPLIDLDIAEQTGESYYLLDGQQRLTSLLLLYNNWSIYRMKTKISRSIISYVPTQNKLILGKKGGVNLSELFRGYLDGRFDKVVANYPAYKNTLEKITRRIIEYKIPIYTIKTLSEDDNVVTEMADAFVRINKAGVRIGTVELMLSFLAGVVSGDFSKQIRSIHRELENRDLDLNTLIRFILSNFGVKQTVFSNVKRFRSNVEKIKFSGEILERSKKAIKFTMDFLHEELGLSTCKIIPSKVSIIPIAKYFYQQQIFTSDNLSENERKDIINWFMIVNMKGYYSSSTNSKLEKDLKIIADSSGAFPYTNLLDNIGERYKIRKADIEKGDGVNVLKKQGLQYLFLLYILLIKERAEDLDGSLLITKKYSDLHRHHIFPKEIFSETDIAPDDPDEKEVYISSLGNITFISGTLHEEIPKNLPDAEPINYLPRYPALQKHFIPPEKELWRLENFERFKQARIELIYNVARKHFREIIE